MVRPELAPGMWLHGRRHTAAAQCAARESLAGAGPCGLTLLAFSSPLMGMTALMPPIAKQPRLWHVFTTSCRRGEYSAAGEGHVRSERIKSVCTCCQ